MRIDRVEVAGTSRRYRDGTLAARLGIERRVGEPQQAGRLLTRLVPDHAATERIGDVAAYQWRRGRVARVVRRLSGGWDQRLEEAVVAQAKSMKQ